MDLSFRKKLIDVIFDDLFMKDCGVIFKIYGFCVLRILSCDKDGLGLFIFDKLLLVLFLLVEFMIEVFKVV